MGAILEIYAIDLELLERTMNWRGPANPQVEETFRLLVRESTLPTVDVPSNFTHASGSRPGSVGQSLASVAALRALGHRVGELSVNSLAVGNLLDWFALTPLAGLRDRATQSPAVVVMPSPSIDVSSGWLGMQQTGELQASASALIEDGIEEATWRGQALAVVLW